MAEQPNPTIQTPQNNSRFGNFFRNNKSSIAGFAGLLALGGLVYRGVSTIGNTIYIGEIDSHRITYIEDKGFFSSENFMTVKTEGKTYRLEDTDSSRVNINWHATSQPAGLNSDQLEKITYTQGKKTETFSREDISDGTLEGRFAEGLFKDADTLYNKTRTTIREKLIDERVKQLEEIKSGLKTK